VLPGCGGRLRQACSARLSVARRALSVSRTRVCVHRRDHDMSNSSASSPYFSSSLLWRLLPLALLILLTRVDHFGSAMHLPDASKAVFFLAGFYLTQAAGRGSNLGFWALLLLVVAIDFISFGLSGRETALCLTPSYPFLLPAYGALWFGG